MKRASGRAQRAGTVVNNALRHSAIRLLGSALRLIVRDCTGFEMVLLMPEESVANTAVNRYTGTRPINLLPTVFSPTYRAAKRLFLGVRSNVPLKVVGFGENTATG